MQEFIGAVGVAFGAEHAAHHHLRARKTQAQHIHQRNRAALPDVAAGSAKVRLRGGIERLFQPGRVVRRVPAGCAATHLKSHFGLVRRVVFEQGFELLHRLRRIDQRRQAQRELEGGVGAQHVAGVFQIGQAIRSGDAERGDPGAVEQGLQRVGGGGQGELAGAAAVVMRPGKALVQLLAQNRCRGLRLRQSLGRHLAMEAGGEQTPAGAVLQPVQHLAHDAKARRHQPAGIARMHALGQHLDFQNPAGHAAQAVGQPELVVIARTRIQAHNQAHIAQARAQHVDVGHQIVGAAFLAGLDKPDDARMRHVLGFQGLDGGDGSISGVAVVGAAPAVQAAVFVFGRPGAEVGAPAGELGLLVQVPVHQHGGV